MDRLIFHVDVNSAYLSWEATRQVARGGLDPRTVPAAIGGARDKRTGVILAKSIPAKRFGVRTGEPVAMALRKCPELLLFPPDFGLYTRCSAAFAAICREYAPAVEQFSIDECFLDFTGTGAIYPDPVALAHTIRERIREELGFTVNIGIAPNKLLAKMASDFEKPDRVHTLFPDEIPAKMWPLPVGELFTVGAATAEKLNRVEIATIGDLARTDLGRLQRLLGQKFGLQLHRYANGLDDSPVRAEPEEAKGYSNSVTLEEDVRTREKSIIVTGKDQVVPEIKGTYVGRSVWDVDGPAKVTGTLKFCDDFEAEEFGGDSLLVRSIPSDIDAPQIQETLEDLAQKLRTCGTADPAAARDAMLHTMACKAAIKGGWVSDPAELQALVDRVASGEVRYCPHGRPVAVKLTRYELEKMFKRA